MHKLSVALAALAAVAPVLGQGCYRVLGTPALRDTTPISDTECSNYCYDTVGAAYYALSNSALRCYCSSDAPSGTPYPDAFCDQDSLTFVRPGESSPVGGTPGNNPTPTPNPGNGNPGQGPQMIPPGLLGLLTGLGAGNNNGLFAPNSPVFGPNGVFAFLNNLLAIITTRPGNNNGGGGGGPVGNSTVKLRRFNKPRGPRVVRLF